MVSRVSGTGSVLDGREVIARARGIAFASTFPGNPDVEDEVFFSVAIAQLAVDLFARPEFRAVTGSDGGFAIEDVPSDLGSPEVRVRFGDRDFETIASGPAPPGGTLDLGTVSTAATLDISAGALQGAGDLTVAGLTTVSGTIYAGLGLTAVMAILMAVLI